MMPNTRPAMPGMKPEVQPARFDGFGQRRLGQALLNHPQQASNPPSPFSPASGTPRPTPLAGAPGSYASSPGVRPGPNFDIYASLGNHTAGQGPTSPPQLPSEAPTRTPTIPGGLPTETAQVMTAQAATQPAPNAANLPPRFADFGQRRLAQALLDRPELAQRQQAPTNGGVVAPETPQVPAQVAGATSTQQSISPEQMSLMLTGSPNPNFDPQQYYNQGITPQHSGDGMIDPRFMVPPGQGPAKATWLDQINSMMGRPTQ